MARILDARLRLRARGVEVALELLGAVEVDDRRGLGDLKTPGDLPFAA
jgi:hypothetical protein